VVVGVTDPEPAPEPIQHPTEDVQPPTDIVEFEQPSTQKVFNASEPTHMDNTRRWIAYGLVLLLATVTIIGALGWWSHGADPQRIQSYAIIFSPVVTLVGTVLGFYFSSGRKSK
jgi:hypothetical protein